jgi:cAMP-dependent protein kinase regulator
VDNHIHTYDNRGAFGELALLYNMPRAASVKAITLGTLWAMDRQTFRRIVLKAAYRKRKMYENLIDKVPMLKSLEASTHARARARAHHIFFSIMQLVVSLMLVSWN